MTDKEMHGHLTVANTVDAGILVRIFLDDVEAKECLECHTGLGWVIQTKKDEAGKLVIEGDEIATIKRFGRVRAEKMDPMP